MLDQNFILAGTLTKNFSLGRKKHGVYSTITEQSVANSSVVYAIYDGENLKKIGKAGVLEGRLNTYQNNTADTNVFVRGEMEEGKVYDVYVYPAPTTRINILGDDVDVPVDPTVIEAAYIKSYLRQTGQRPPWNRQIG